VLYFLTSQQAFFCKRAVIEYEESAMWNYIISSSVSIFSVTAELFSTYTLLDVNDLRNKHPGWGAM
jgi:hypothetical protein